MAHRVSPVLKVLQVLVLLAQQARLVPLAHRATKVHRDHKVLEVLLGHKVLPEPREIKEIPEPRAHKVQVEPLAQQVNQVLSVLQEQEGKLDRKAQLVLWGQQAQLVLLAHKGYREKLEQPVPQVFVVLKDPREIAEIQALVAFPP